MTSTEPGWIVHGTGAAGDDPEVAPTVTDTVLLNPGTGPVVVVTNAGVAGGVPVGLGSISRVRSTTANTWWRMFVPVAAPSSSPSLTGRVVSSTTRKKPTVHHTAKALLRVVTLP